MKALTVLHTRAKNILIPHPHVKGTYKFITYSDLWTIEQLVFWIGELLFKIMLKISETQSTYRGTTYRYKYLLRICTCMKQLSKIYEHKWMACPIYINFLSEIYKSLIRST